MADANTPLQPVDVLAVDEAVARSSGAQDYGLTASGFTPKPFSRLLAEKLSLARALFGADLDLQPGSAIRKLLEISALEDARTWSALASVHEDLYVSTATGAALSRLGEELGLARPHLEAAGTVKLKLLGALDPPDGTLELPAGGRLLSSGGHHAYLSQTVVLSAATAEREVGVTAFYPGPEHDLDPGKTVGADHPEKLALWNRQDDKLADLFAAASGAGAATPEGFVSIDHSKPLTGGASFWPDDRYRALLLQAPRSLWSVDALRMAVSLVPGVRQVQVRDTYGGLDVKRAVFGYFSFLERAFSGERDVASPYFFDVLVAPTDAALWDGPDGLELAVEAALEDLRPIGVFPNIQEAEQVWVGLSADLVVKDLPLPRAGGTALAGAPAVQALFARLGARVKRYVEGVQFGEPVRLAEVTWAMMSEPGMTDVQNLKLLKFPPDDPNALTVGVGGRAFQVVEGNVKVQSTQIASFVDDYSQLRIVG